MDDALAAAIALTFVPVGLLWLPAGDWVNDRYFGGNDITLIFVLCAPFVLFGWAAYFASKLA